jgi:hypothetical protein
MRRLFPIIIVLPLVAGCAMFRPTDASWVDASAETDAGLLSEAIVAFVAQSVPQQGTVVDVAAPPEAQSKNVITVQIREQLTGRGYRLEGPDSGPRHRLRYVITQHQDRILLRVTLEGPEVGSCVMSVVFGRDGAGRLHAAGPVTMRRKGEVL